MTEDAHSTIGASSAERWMNCPGSVDLVNRFLATREGDDGDEPEYRAAGTAAHEFAAALLRDGGDAWEVVGQKAENGFAIDGSLADAVQRYLDECRGLAARAQADGYTGPTQTMIEQRVGIETIPGYFGTLDFGLIAGRILYLRDFKAGMGVLVEVEDNPQFLYYANAVLDGHPDIQTVDIGVVQPRMHHPNGPVRTWRVSASKVREWAMSELYPAMQRARRDATLAPGEWCRFCPVKVECPALQALFKAACQTSVDRAKGFEDNMLALNYSMIGPVKQFIKALEDEVYRRVVTVGANVPGVKAVRKKANRVWKDAAAAVVAERLKGRDIYTAPALKSPAEIDKLGPDARAVTAEWAFTPDTGYTVAPVSDPRAAVKIEPPSRTFAQALTAPTEEW